MACHRPRRWQCSGVSMWQTPGVRLLADAFGPVWVRPSGGDGATPAERDGARAVQSVEPCVHGMGSNASMNTSLGPRPSTAEPGGVSPATNN